MFETTGKWPSQQAVGTERDPDNVAPLVVYLASRRRRRRQRPGLPLVRLRLHAPAAAHPVRRVEANRRLEPAELAKLFPQTLGRLAPPAARHRLRPHAGRPAGRGVEGPRQRRPLLAVPQGGPVSRTHRPLRLPRQHVPERDGARAPREDARRAPRRPRRAGALGGRREHRPGRHDPIARRAHRAAGGWDRAGRGHLRLDRSPASSSPDR